MVAAALLLFNDGGQWLSSLNSSHDISLAISIESSFVVASDALHAPGWNSGTIMMGSDIHRVSIDRLPSSRPVPQRLNRKAKYSAGYIPGDRERRAPQLNLTLNPAQLELAAALACRAYMLVSIVFALSRA